MINVTVFKYDCNEVYIVYNNEINTLLTKKFSNVIYLLIYYLLNMMFVVFH